jgi:hypothetical protein
MLDTIKFFTDDFRVQSDAEMQIQPSVIDFRTGEQNNKKLFISDGGKWVKGEKAYLNDERFNITIKPMSNSDAVYLWVQLSAPKFLTGDNFYPLGDVDARGLPVALEKELRTRGIGLSAAGLKLSRLDTFKNVYADEPFNDYVSIFKMLNAKRQLRRDYGSTFLWENTQREICVYDKLTEIQNRGFSVEGLPKNTIRFEYRLLNSKVIKNALGLKTAGALFENLDAVREVYRDALKYHLFGLDVSEFEKLVGSQWYALVRYYFTNEGRFWRSRLRQNVGDYYISGSIGVKKFREIVEDVAGYRQAGYVAEKEVNEGALQVELLTGQRKNKTTVELYQELQNKVLEVS